MHNILITGGEQSDRVNFATEYTQALLCVNPTNKKACHVCNNCTRIASHTHPNLVWVTLSTPEANDDQKNDQSSLGNLSVIKIDQIRRIITEHHKASFEDGISAFIITHMHRATTSAANALLKVMEENQPNKVFIALAPSRTSVQKTIASRLACHTIKPAPLHLMPYDHQHHELINKICAIPRKDRFELCSQFSSDREELMMHLEELTHTCHALIRNNILASRLGLGILMGLATAKSELKKNQNPRLIIEHLLLCLWPIQHFSIEQSTLCRPTT